MSAIGADDYLTFCEGLRQICGIDLSQYKRPQMERRLRSFFARKGISNLSTSLPALRADKAQLDALLDRVTINVSQLWRHPEQWTRLERDLLGQLSAGGSLSAWSAGCSYGAEAFTLAAVCRKAIPRAKVRILGTDIDPRMVARAKTGAFSHEDARGVVPSDMQPSFTATPDGWQACPELLAMTRFEVGDLLRIRPAAAAHDLVMCRNTVIYFAEPIRDELHGRLARSLKPGGCLVIGATERVSKPGPLGLEPLFPFIYRKT